MADKLPCDQGIGIAIFGLGRAGTIHFKNCLINPRVDLRYIVDIDTEKVDKYIAEYRLKDTKVLPPTEIDNVLDDPLVHGVIIATFTHLHEEQVLRCLKAKKAVFCEKPLASTYEGTEHCYKEAYKHQAPLLCAFNRRFDKAHRAVKDGVSDGKIGQLQMVKTCSRDFPKPSFGSLKATNGIFHDCAIHDIDMVMWIVGERPKTLTVQAHAFREDIAEINDVDTVAITMKFPSGIIGMIDLSRYAAYGYDQRVEAFGDAGMLQSQNYSASSICYSSSAGQCEDTLKFSFPQRYDEAYRNELEHFLDIIRGRDLLVKGEDTLAASKVAQACEDAHRTGQVIHLTWD